jgi:arsenite-transporting ATPase
LSMSLVNVSGEKIKLIMVGGKGGVGKTTCASAIALKMAREGRRVLVISSDPTPSLSDIFETTIGSEEVRITGEMELYGLEISSEVVLNRWKERFGQEIYEVVSSFANVDYDFVDYVGTAPGIEEEYMLSYIIDLVDGGAYDVVVWDTAPAGHTMRLLKLPHLFLKHLEAATKFYMNMYSYVEKMKEMARLKGSKRTLLEIIGSWEALAERIVAFIRDRERTKYVLVTIPEALGVKLTGRIMEDFRENGLEVENMIINNVVKDADCEFHRIRSEMQEGYIRFIKEGFASVNVVILHLLPVEVRGIERIGCISDALFASAHEG